MFVLFFCYFISSTLWEFKKVKFEVFNGNLELNE